MGPRGGQGPSQTRVHDPPRLALGTYPCISPDAGAESSSSPPPHLPHSSLGKFSPPGLFGAWCQAAGDPPGGAYVGLCTRAWWSSTLRTPAAQAHSSEGS